MSLEKNAETPIYPKSGVQSINDIPHSHVTCSPNPPHATQTSNASSHLLDVKKAGIQFPVSHSQSPIMSKTITYQFNTKTTTTTNDHGHTNHTKNDNQKPRERSKTAGQPSRPTLHPHPMKKSATIGPLPRSPLLNKRQISQSDMEKELQRMYGSLPTKPGGHSNHEHSEFCSCKVKGCNY